MHSLALFLAYKQVQNVGFLHGDIPLTILITTYSHKAALGLGLLLYSRLHSYTHTSHDTGPVKKREIKNARLSSATASFTAPVWILHIDTLQTQ